MTAFITMVENMREAQKRHEYTFDQRHLQEKKQRESAVDEYIRCNNISELILSDRITMAEKLIREWLTNERIIDRTPADDEQLILIKQKAMALVDFDVK